MAWGLVVVVVSSVVQFEFLLLVPCATPWLWGRVQVVLWGHITFRES